MFILPFFLACGTPDSKTEDSAGDSNASTTTSPIQVVSEGITDLTDSATDPKGNQGPWSDVSFDRPYAKYAQIYDNPMSIGSGEWLCFEFPLAYWLEQHGPLNRDDAAIRRFFLAYEQNHRLRSDYDRPGCDVDGVTIQTFESASKFFEMAMDPIYEARIHPDELKFLARDNLIWMLTDAEDVIVDRT